MKILSFLACFLIIMWAGERGEAADPFKVAAIFAKTGPAADSNLKELRGVRFAAEKLRHEGGILGTPLELIEIDNQSTALGSKSAAQEAIAAGAVAVIGASWSSHSLAMAPVLQEAKIPMISPISTHPKLTEAGNYIFRTCYLDSFQGAVMADFAIDDLGVSKVAVLTNTGQRYSLDLAGYFIRRFDQRYGKQLWEFDYLENVSDFDMLLQKVKDRKPEAIFLPGYHNDSAMILKKSRQTGIDAVFIGADGWSGDLMYNIAGASLDGSYCCDHWHRDNPDPVSRRFVAAYEKRYGKLLSSGPALSYDATLLLADAISRANSFNPKNIRDALESTKDFHGVTGKITFNEQRNPSKCAVILKFEKNTVRYVKNVWTK